MKNIKLVAILMLGISFLFSCVSQKEFDALQANYKTCLDNNGQKEGTIGEQRVRISSLEEQLARLEKNNQNLKESLDKCIAGSNQGSANISKLIDEVNSSNKYIKQLVESKFKNDSMNLALSNKLKRSLSDLGDDDVNIKVLKGVVFISLSDKMMYKTGSFEILPQADSVLQKVALVINDYKDYDVLVEGHTDNVDFSGKSGFRDNWDLSALRATSVVRTLQNRFNVDPARMTAGGRSMFVPKASNDTPMGRSANRRTEIIIMPKLDEFLKLMDQAPAN